MLNILGAVPYVGSWNRTSINPRPLKEKALPLSYTDVYDCQCV